MFYDTNTTMLRDKLHDTRHMCVGVTRSHRWVAARIASVTNHYNVTSPESSYVGIDQ